MKILWQSLLSKYHSALSWGKIYRVHAEKVESGQTKIVTEKLAVWKQKKVGKLGGGGGGSPKLVKWPTGYLFHFDMVPKRRKNKRKKDVPFSCSKSVCSVHYFSLFFKSFQNNFKAQEFLC